MKQFTLPRKKKSGSDTYPQQIHFNQIDILKGLAIISVVLIHTYNNDTLGAMGAPFYLLQAVPVFLLLAAFTNAWALTSARKTTLLQSYDLTIISRRLNRLLVPYVVIWIFQFLVVLGFIVYKIDLPIQNPNHFFYTGIDGLFNFLSGGNGMGNYFIPIILQQILIIPVLYYLALRSPNRMLVMAFIMDLVLEYIAVLLGLPAWLNSIIYIRYIFIGALGVWLVFRERVITRWILFGGLISAVYIYAVYYLNFQFWFFSPYDSFFHAFSYLWTLVIVVLGIQFLPPDSCNKIYLALQELGKASWHIFLVQMTFFSLSGNPFIWSCPLVQSFIWPCSASSPASRSAMGSTGFRWL